MKWTQKQQQAIELRDKNILVAAAAGSGKTAVLVERIKKLAVEEGIGIDHMLIVTFTNAAAAEMKEKIRKALSSALTEIAKSPDPDQAKLSFLKRQLDLMSSANISTFHSFALDVIRRYFYLLQIEPNFKICDSTQETLFKEQAMDQLVEELFEKSEPEFFHFLKCYSGDRDENRFRSLVENCYNTIRSLPEPFEWLSHSVNQLKNGQALKTGPAAEYIFKIAKSKLRDAGESLKTNIQIAMDEDLEGLSILCGLDQDQLAKLRQALEAQDYETFAQAVRSFKLPTFNAKVLGHKPDLKDRVSENRANIRKAIKELKDVYFAGSLDDLCHEMSLTYDSGIYLEKLLHRYSDLYSQIKRNKNMVDFGDIEHYAYEILKDPEAASFYRNRFDHIFIDEYQDSNVIQEALIDLIKRPNNLFMVGDVKQSIYKFRLAEPEIFESKYASYRDGLVKASAKIDLNQNFRSKKPIIHFINTIFQQIMDGYDEEARLYPGDGFADRATDQPYVALTQVPWDDEEDLDDELKDIIKAEKEAMAAASLIKENLGETIFDSKLGKERALQKRDIVILMRSVKNYGDIFHKVFTENDLPAYIDDSDGFFNTMEIDSFLSALYIIDNPKQDIPLLTLLRSEMMNFEIQELVAIRLPFKEGSYHDAFCAYAQEGPDLALRTKCQEALEKIHSWRETSRIMPLDKLISKLLLDTGFYLTMGAMPAGSQRQANLRALVDKAHSYQMNNRSSLYGFIRYIEAIKEKKVAMGQVKLMGEKDDLIRIMTVHKSKGLEFPMVILAGFCRRLTYSSAGKAPVIHKDLGLGFPLVDPENRWYKTTLLQNMIKERFRKEEVAEEKRILYVALTRAKDRLILLGICDNVQKDIIKVKSSDPGDSSYFSMSGKVICRELDACHMMDNRKILGLSKGTQNSRSKILKIMDQCAQLRVSQDTESKMTYVYPYEHEMTLRAKYSVSQLNSQGRKAIEDLAEPKLASTEKALTPAQRGTIYHSLLEHIDFAKALEGGTAYLEGLIKDMIAKEMLPKDAEDIIDVKLIEKLTQSDLARRMVNSPKLEKEKRFNLITDQGQDKVMVRGIIDCFFEEDGKLVLLDYKTGGAHASPVNNYQSIRALYQTQLELYSKALYEATGKEVKEMYLYLTDLGQLVKM